MKEKIKKNRKIIFGSIIFVLVLLIILILNDFRLKTQTGFTIKSQETVFASSVSEEIQFLGKWYGLADVYLGKNEETGQYGATFEPLLEPTEQNTTQFALSLIDEIWGLNVLKEGVEGRTPYLEERLGTILMYYKMKDGNRIYFLVMKDTDTGKIFGMGFWRESTSEANTRYKTESRDEEGCFIATAAYGTPLAPEIDILRDFRDAFLLKTNLGKKFVKFYYKSSPPVANFISKQPILKEIIREAGIKPIVKVLNFTEDIWDQ